MYFHFTLNIYNTNFYFKNLTTKLYINVLKIIFFRFFGREEMYLGKCGSRSTKPVRLNWLRGDWKLFYFIISISIKK